MKQAVTGGTTCITTNATDLFACDAIECIIEATGHASQACAMGSQPLMRANT
jgi:predicted homoserine dehydrogenase-like protein